MNPDTEANSTAGTIPQKVREIEAKKKGYLSKKQPFKVLWSENETNTISSDFPLIGLGLATPKTKSNKAKLEP